VKLRDDKLKGVDDFYKMKYILTSSIRVLSDFLSYTYSNFIILLRLTDSGRINSKKKESVY
jgi:hypothetical protein